MNHPGELSNLSKIAQPDVAAITSIAAAHIENFGSLDGIAAAKLEIVDGLKPSGVLILNRDDDALQRNFSRLQLNQNLRIQYFGGLEGSDARIDDIRLFGMDGIAFCLTLHGHSAEVRMDLMGRHNAYNAACAALVAKCLCPEIEMNDVVAALTSFRAPLMRLNTRQLGANKRLIDDSYNANPASMRAALELARDLAHNGTRVGLVLGDMLELGNFSEYYHQEIGIHAMLAKPAFVIALGTYAAQILDESARAGIPVFEAKSAEEAARIATAQDFDVLLVKASRGVGLDRSVALLMGE